MMRDIQFANPEFFWLFILLPLLAVWQWFVVPRRTPDITFSSFEPLKAYRPGLRVKLRFIPSALRFSALALMIFALARPQSSASGQNITTEGIDIVLAFDISGSMLAEDFKPNRIEAAKKVAIDFIDGRPDDRIGLVVFSGESFTQCPLTTDHSVLKNLLLSLESGMITDGTAIGMGLATSVSRLKESKAKSKVIILLTDGVNNAGFVAPYTAAEIARTFGIRVYTIGVGTRGMAPYPIKTPLGTQYQNMEVQIDETSLQQIAQETEGKYFRATNNKKLEEVYRSIDKLEKTKIEVISFHKHTEEFLPFALIAGLLLLLELMLRYTVFKTLP